MLHLPCSEFSLKFRVFLPVVLSGATTAPLGTVAASVEKLTALDAHFLRLACAGRGSNRDCRRRRLLKMAAPVAQGPLTGTVERGLQ
jgi:hypothetical protein